MTVHIKRNDEIRGENKQIGNSTVVVCVYLSDTVARVPYHVPSCPIWGLFVIPVILNQSTKSLLKPDVSACIQLHLPPDAPVDGVEVPDVEGGVGVGGGEGVGEQAQPSVVSREHHTLAPAVSELQIKKYLLNLLALATSYKKR